MTAKTSRLHRRYPYLTLAERVQLHLSAQERGDLSELKALDWACLGADVPSYVARLLLLGGAACLLVVQLLAHETLLVKRLSDLAQDDATNPASDPALLSLLRRQAALWRGFSAWCRDLGHDPRQVLLLAPLGPHENDPAYFVLHQHIACLDACYPHLSDDPHQVQIWHDFFTRSFQCA